MTIEWEWEIELDPGSWHGPPLPKCELGVKGHKWVFFIEMGQLVIRRDDDATCLAEQCQDYLGMVGWEDVYSREVPCEIIFEPGCGNPGGWHGMNRCDCGYAWVIIPEGME